MSLQVAMHALQQGPENFKIPAAPDLIPDGPWEKLPVGNCTTPKGFKATGWYGNMKAVAIISAVAPQ